jgi:hypothetical protein
MRNKITRNDKGGGGNNEPIHHCDTNKNRKQKLMSNFRQKKNTALTKHQQLFAPRLHCHILLEHKY